MQVSSTSVRTSAGGGDADAGEFYLNQNLWEEVMLMQVSSTSIRTSGRR